MFHEGTQQEPQQPFYKSLAFLIVVSIILPPVGFILLWTRQDLNMKAKAAAAVLIVGLGVGYFSLYTFASRKWYGNDEHYSELERHRAQQKQQFDNQSGQQSANPNQQSATDAGNNPAQPATGQQGAQQPNGQATDTAHAAGEYWSDFRGPNRDGVSRDAIKTNWSGLTPAWKQPVGGGYSSFVVGEGRAYTIEQRRGQEVVAAYDLQTGREVWTQAWNAFFQESMGGDGPRATPTYSEGRIYALGAAGDFRCLDAKSGKQIWGKNILSETGASNIQWGMSAAPLIVDDKVIAQPGGSNNNSIVAYNKNNGAVIWKSLNDNASYTSPMLVTLAGKRQILTVTDSRVVGLAPENGALLWDYSWSNSASINVSQPIVVDSNRVFISAGYGKGAALFEVAGNSGKFAAKTIWENSNMKNKFQSSVLLNGYIYGLDEGILSCIDVNTGERKWKGGRYGYGQLIAASGHLIIVAEDGRLVLVKATPEKHEELTQIQALQGRSWNAPTIANGKLLIRNGSDMACYNIAQ